MENEKRLDLIDRKALGIGRCNPDAFPLQNRGYVAGWNGVISILEQAPRVDAVEVVMIKEVQQKILETLDTLMATNAELANYAERNSYYRGKVNAYEVARRLVNAALTELCSYGERREGE